VPRRVVQVDPRFPRLLEELRRWRGLSLRRLVRTVNYSHTYLWEVETGRKPPTLAMAAAVDRALDAGGELAALVVERLVDEPASAGSLGSAATRVANLDEAGLAAMLDAQRPRLEALASGARFVRFARSPAGVLVAASQGACRHLTDAALSPGCHVGVAA
jgi:hypothetical protein